MRVEPPRHIEWSTRAIDLEDPFQRRHYIRQVLLHGLTEDIRTLDIHEVAQVLDELNLPAEVYTLRKRLFEAHGYAAR